MVNNSIIANLVACKDEKESANPPKLPPSPVPQRGNGAARWIFEKKLRLR